MDQLSVVICTHDSRRWEDLQAAVGSLSGQTLRPREVIVVVDHNPDLQRRAARTLDGTIVISNREPRGLGGARNSGVAAASGDIVAFLDDDTIATPEWVRLLTDQYIDECVAGAGGSAEPVWETDRPAWFPNEFDWVVGCSYLGMPARTTDVRNFFGCNMSFRRDLLTALGGFRLGYGCDETELCIRLRKRWPNMRLVYVPQARVYHSVTADRTRLRRFISRCYFEGGSKAVVSKIAGARAGLSTEYGYTRTVLPEGVRRGVTDALRRRDPYGLARAAVIVAGFLSTASGYVVGNMRPREAARRRGWSGPPLA